MQEGGQEKVVRTAGQLRGLAVVAQRLAEELSEDHPMKPILKKLTVQTAQHVPVPPDVPDLYFAVLTCLTDAYERSTVVTWAGHSTRPRDHDRAAVPSEDESSTDPLDDSSEPEDSCENDAQDGGTWFGSFVPLW